MREAIKTKTMSFRIEPDLLEALKDRAKEAGRSASSELSQLLKSYLTPKPKKKKRVFNTMGMFAHLGEAPSFEEIRKIKDETARQIYEKIDRFSI